MQIRMIASSNKKADLVKRLDDKLDKPMITDNPLDRHSVIFEVKGMDMDVYESEIIDAFRKVTGPQTPISDENSLLRYDERVRALPARAAEVLADRRNLIIV